ncbi:hypothetical protein AB0H83_48850, partial [Dactylosporangium sp. NPDC050688]|uniref:hypothetical protein n=1 Tax=Dactylosporangium sp. NPDC050688 TaxID=3157217 RepID=UPI0033C23CDD
MSTDALDTPAAPASPASPAPRAARAVPDVTRRRLARPGRATPGFWLAAVLVTGIGLLLRMVNL